MPISACPARRRPYCAASDRPRHHHCATTAPLVSPRFPRRKNGCRRRARRAGGVEEGALSGTARSLPRVAGERKKVEVPSRVRTNASVYCRTYCCTVVAHGSWVVLRVDGLAGGRVGASFRTWVSAFVPLGGGPVLAFGAVCCVISSTNQRLCFLLYITLYCCSTWWLGWFVGG